MPYDPRPTTEGGNRGIDVDFSRSAPKGKYRLVSVDTFDGGDCVIGDYNTLEEARSSSEERTKNAQMMLEYVYNDRGQCVYSGGRF